MYLSGIDYSTKDNENRDTKNPREEKSDKVFEKEVIDDGKLQRFLHRNL